MRRGGWDGASQYLQPPARIKVGAVFNVSCQSVHPPVHLISCTHPETRDRAAGSSKLQLICRFDPGD